MPGTKIPSPHMYEPENALDFTGITVSINCFLSILQLQLIRLHSFTDLATASVFRRPRIVTSTHKIKRDRNVSSTLFINNLAGYTGGVKRTSRDAILHRMCILHFDLKLCIQLTGLKRSRKEIIHIDFTLVQK